MPRNVAQLTHLQKQLLIAANRLATRERRINFEVLPTRISSHAQWCACNECLGVLDALACSCSVGASNMTLQVSHSAVHRAGGVGRGQVSR